MSVVSLETVREFLVLTQISDDPKIQRLIDGAEDEAMRYMDRDTLPRSGSDPQSSESSANPVSDSNAVAPSVVTAICLLVQADYDQTGNDAILTKKIAFSKLMPYRQKMGV
jgi:hypothetical protein